MYSLLLRYTIGSVSDETNCKNACDEGAGRGGGVRHDRADGRPDDRRADRQDLYGRGRRRGVVFEGSFFAGRYLSVGSSAAIRGKEKRFFGAFA